MFIPKVLKLFDVADARLLGIETTWNPDVKLNLEANFNNSLGFSAWNELLNKLKPCENLFTDLEFKYCLDHKEETYNRCIKLKDFFLLTFFLRTKSIIPLLNLLNFVFLRKILNLCELAILARSDLSTKLSIYDHLRTTH